MEATNKLRSIEVTLNPVTAASREKSYSELAALAKKTGFEIPPDRGAYPFTRLEQTTSVTLHHRSRVQENALPSIPRNISSDSSGVFEAMIHPEIFETYADRVEKSISTQRMRK